MKVASRIVPLSAALVLLPVAASAHPGVGPTGGFMHGFAHPMSGPDHVLAMVMVGILAYQLGGRALLLVPAAFISVMAFAGALGVSQIPVPFVQSGIALSVVILGGVVATGLRASVVVAAGIVGLFAVFHGYAHGAEMSEDASAITYAAGFMAATALLHATGLGLSFLIDQVGERRGPAIMRTAGAAAVIAGLGFFTGLL